MIFISGLDETTDKIKGFVAGGVDYIIKPFRVAEVLARIETHLSLHHLQKQLRVQNIRLQQEIIKRERFEEELKTSRVYLEDLITERTKDLRNINDKLQEEIAEHNRIKEAVIRDKNEWEMTFDAVPDLISMIDENYRIVRVNKAMADRLGLLPNEVLGSRCHQVVHNTEVPPPSCPHAMLLADGQEHMSEIYIEKLDATFIVSVSPLYDNKGQLRHCVHVARDISSRKQLEKALEKSNEQYRSLVESANDIIFRTDTTGVFTFVNPIAMRILGYSQEELIGKHYLALIRPDMRDAAAKFLGRQFVNKLANTYYEFPIIKKDGQELWIGQNTQLLLENEQVIGFQAVARDITDLKLAGEALKTSEQKYRILMENSSDAILLADTEGNIIEANRKAEELWGYSIKELLQMHYTQLHPVPELERTIAAFTDIIEKNKGHLSGGFIQRKDSNIVPVDITCNVVEYAERKVVQGSFRDISEYKKAKDILETLVKKRTAELSWNNEQLKFEIRERKSAEVSLKKKTNELQLHSSKLEELNTALKVLLQQREEDRTYIEEKVLLNVKHLLTPHFEALKKRDMDQESKVILEILESNTKNMTSSFAHKLSSKYLNFTPTEIKVANHVKEGKQIKEIAEIMGVSHYAIELHRFNIRKKLGLKSRKINLQSYLLSLS